MTFYCYKHPVMNNMQLSEGKRA